MKRVLITGASGFIGRHTYSGLLAKGYEIHAAGFGPMLSKSADLHYHDRNLLDPSQISHLLKEVAPTHLLHFAWYAAPGKYLNSPLNLEWVKASLELLQQFVNQGGKRAVFSGTCAEYDWSSGFCSESSTALNSNTLYGTCKAALSQIVQAYSKQVGLSCSWARPFFLFGPYEYPERLVPSVIQSLLKKEVARCSLGTQIRDFLYVQDVADAFVELLDSELQGAVNIGSGQPVALKDIIHYIAKTLGSQDQIHYGAIPTSASEAPRVEADIKRLFNELNWRPKYSLEQGLDQTIAWWKAQNQVVV